jgi:hypothetical protein
MTWRHNHRRHVKKPSRQVNRSGALPGANARTLCRADNKPAHAAENAINRRACALPPDERRQAHEVGFRIRIGAEPELGTAVINQIEFYVAAALHE